MQEEEIKEVKNVYNENISRLNPDFKKLFSETELSPTLGIGDEWKQDIGNNHKLWCVKGFEYRNCSSGKIVCYVLETKDEHKSKASFPCWNLDRFLKEGPKKKDTSIKYALAIKEANRLIFESDKVVFPNTASVNMARAFLDLKLRYIEATEHLSFLRKVNSMYIERPHKDKTVEEAFKLVDDFLSEDWDFQIDMHNEGN